MLLDGLARACLDAPHDEDGAAAARGHADHDWVRELAAADWFQLKPPKAAGREQFGRHYLAAFRAEAGRRRLGVDDQFATAVELSVQGVVQALRFLPLTTDTELYVTGGGRRNATLMQRLADAVACRVAGIEVLGVRIDAKEAVDFAVLGNESLHGHAGNLVRVTGAQRPVVLGTLALSGFPPRLAPPGGQPA